jgi:hypothetical protein
LIFRHLNRFQTGWKIFIGIGEVAASVAVIVAAVHFVAGDDDNPGAHPAATPSVQTAERKPTPQPTASTTPVAGPKCWTTAKAVVDCRETHRYEEIPQAPTCTEAVVTGFLGGLATVDVLVAHPAALPGVTCALDAGHDVNDSAKDVLQTDDHAVWRRCFDKAKNSNIPCSEDHTGEYVATGNPRRATEADCLVAAATYLDQLPGNLTEDLIVRPIDVKTGHPDPARCIIDARGNHRLTTTVRNLGSRPVPILSN